MSLALRRRLLEKVADADRDQHAVDGAPWAGFLEELEKALPGGRVDVAVALLGGVPPGRVEEHSLVGEPPIAVPGAADAANCLTTYAIGEREPEA